MYNLTEHNKNYSKTSGSLFQHYRDELSLNDNGVIDKFPGNSAANKFKQQITGETPADGTKDIETMYH